jgi:hypothetical protein
MALNRLPAELQGTIGACVYRSGATYLATLTIAPANISELNDVFCLVHGAFSCMGRFLDHYRHVLDPLEPQRERKHAVKIAL